MPPGATRSRESRSWTRDPALLIALGLQAIFGALFIASTRFMVGTVTFFTLFDDAMISMRYARHLAEGAGLGWNRGEAPVEGYTNLLWTLWMSLLHRVGAPQSKISLLVMLSGLALLLVNLVVIWHIARRLSASPWGARVAVICVALTYPLNFWTLRGMEVGLMALCIDLAVYEAMTSTERLGSWDTLRQSLWLGALPLIRPDGLLPALLIAGYQCWWPGGGRRPRIVWALPAVPIVVVLAHTAFRLTEYHAWLPNTYYLKVEGIPAAVRAARGATALGEVVRETLWPVVLLMLAAPWRRPVALLAAVVGAQALYSVAVGGDAWEWARFANRYLTVVLPLAIVLAACGAERLCKAGRSPSAPREIGARVAMAGMTAVLLLALSGNGMWEWLHGRAVHVADDAIMAQLGLDLEAATAPGVTIGVVWAGAVPYFANRPAVDFLGKSDRWVAKLPPRLPFVPGHNKWDYTYSIGKRRPDIVAQLWRPTQRDIEYVVGRGYRRVGAIAFVLDGTARLDVPAVEAAFQRLERRRREAAAR